MKCVDHPTKDAVAILTNTKYDSQIGVCIECYNKHKKNINIINGRG